jgi:hypothetical protein
VHRGRHLATRRRPALSWFLLAKPSFVELFSPFVFSYSRKVLRQRWALLKCFRLLDFVVKGTLLPA